MSAPVTIPLLNPNEPEALLAALHVSEGQQVAEGDLLCTLETTKSTADVVAEGAGFIVGLVVVEGDTVRAGDLLCYLAESADWQPPEVESGTKGVSDQTEMPMSGLPEGLRITQPALVLVRQHDLDISTFPIGPLVTEKMVEILLEKSTSTAFAVPKSEFDPMSLIIYGAGGHGKACLDLVRALGTFRVVGFVDDGMPAGEEIMGVPVLGGSEVLADARAWGVRQAVNAVGGIGNVSVRVAVFAKLAQAGFVCPPVVHPVAFVESSATLAPGVQVFPHAYVGSEAVVGFGSIVNTGAILSHDCVLGDYVNISPGAILAGEVHVENGALVGMGVTVNLRAVIGAGARVGNGSTVKNDVPPGGVVRAGTVWPK
jgi:acetyltransferase EpsM